jgi:exosortase/archaeosortase family protein
MAKRKQSERKRGDLRTRSLAQRPGEPSKPLSLREIVRSKRIFFPIAFVLSCIALFVTIQVLPPSFTQPVDENIAWSLGMVLIASGIPASINHDTVSDGELSFGIVPECTPIFTAGILFCFIAFYPATLRRKLVGLIIGVAALYLGNLARLTLTFVISRHHRRLFEVVHVYLGQVFMIFLVILTCIVWLEWVDREDSKKSMLISVGTSILTRFAMFSSGLFFVWMQIHHWYIWLLDRFVLFGFSFFGYRFTFAQHTVYYYETFSIVCFTSMVFSARSLPPAMKVRVLAAGLGLLFLTHLFHRIDNALVAYFNFTSILPVDFTLLVVGQYLLPVLLLISLVYYQRQSQNRLRVTSTQ